MRWFTFWLLHQTSRYLSLWWLGSISRGKWSIGIMVVKACWIMDSRSNTQDLTALPAEQTNVWNGTAALWCKQSLLVFMAHLLLTVTQTVCDCGGGSPELLYCMLRWSRVECKWWKLKIVSASIKQLYLIFLSKQNYDIQWTHLLKLGTLFWECQLTCHFTIVSQ